MQPLITGRPVPAPVVTETRKGKRHGERSVEREVHARADLAKVADEDDEIEPKTQTAEYRHWSQILESLQETAGADGETASLIA